MENHFLEYTETLERIKELHSKIAILKEAIYSVKGVSYDDVLKTQGSSGADIGYYIAEIDELEEELEILQEKKKKLKAKHLIEIGRVKNWKYRKLLRLLYIDNRSLNEAAVEMQKSSSHCRKLKAKAISDFFREMSENDIK